MTSVGSVVIPIGLETGIFETQLATVDRLLTEFGIDIQKSMNLATNSVNKLLQDYNNAVNQASTGGGNWYDDLYNRIKLIQGLSGGFRDFFNGKDQWLTVHTRTLSSWASQQEYLKNVNILGQSAQKRLADFATGSSKIQVAANATNYWKIALTEVNAVLSATKSTIGLLQFPNDLQITTNEFLNSFTLINTKINEFRNLSDKVLANVALLSSGAGFGIGGLQQALVQGMDGLNIANMFQAEQGIETYIDVSKAFSPLKSLARASGETEKAINSVWLQAQKLSSQTSLSAKEIAEASTILYKLGFSLDDVQNSLYGVVRSSEASGKSIQEMADTIATTMSQFNLAAQDSEKIADLLVKASSSSSLDISQLSQALANTGAVANGANQQLKTIVSTLGLLSDSGIRGERAGTALNEALKSLQINALKAGDSGGDQTSVALKAIGLGKSDLLNAQGNLKDFLDIVKSIKQGVGSLSETADGQASVAPYLSQIFGSTGLKAILPLIGKTTKEIDALQATIADSSGFSTSTAVKNLDTFEGSLKILSGSIETVSLRVGELFAPAMQKIVEITTEAINVILSIPPSIFKFMAILPTLTALIISYYKGISIANLFLDAFKNTKKILAFTTTYLTSLFTAEGRALAFASVQAKQAQIAQALLSTKTAVSIFLQKVWNKQITLTSIALNLWGLRAAAVTKASVALNSSVLSNLKTFVNHVAIMGKLTISFLLLQKTYQIFMAAINSLPESLKTVEGMFLALSVSIGVVGTALLVLKGTMQLTTVGVVLQAIVVIGLLVKHFVDFSKKIPLAGRVTLGLVAAFAMAIGAAKIFNTSILVATKGVAVFSFNALKAAVTSLLSFVLGTNQAIVGLNAFYLNLVKFAAFALATAAVLYAFGKVWDMMADSESVVRMKEATKELSELAIKSEKLTDSLKETSKTLDSLKSRFSGFNSLVEQNGFNLLAWVKSYEETYKAANNFLGSMKQLEEQQKSLNQIYDYSIDIIKKYGVEQVNQSNASNFSKETTENFTKEANAQIKIINESIAALRKQKPENEEVANQVAMQISFLEMQNKMLQKRVILLNQDAQALANNSELQENLITNLEDLTQKYEELSSVLNLAKKGQVANVEEALAKGHINVADAVKARHEIEKNAIQSSIDINNEALKQLKETQQWLPEEDRAKAEEEIAKRSEKAIDLRIDAAKKEFEEKQKINQQIIKDEVDKFAQLQSVNKLKNAQKIENIKGQEFSGSISKEQANTEILNVEINANKQLIALEKKRLESQERLLKQGVITKEKFDQESLKTSQNLVDLKIGLINKETKVIESAYQQRTSSLQENIKQQQLLYESASQNQINQIKQVQLSGGMSAESAAKAIQEIEKKQIKNKIILQQESLLETKRMLQEGLMTQQEFNKQKNELDKNIASLDGEILNQQLQQQKESQQKKKESIEQALKKQTDIQQLAQKQQIVSLQIQNSKGLLSQKEYAHKKQQLELESVNQSIANERQALQMLKEMLDQGIINEQEFADRKNQLQQKALDQVTQKLEMEADIRKKKIKEATSQIQEESTKQEKLLAIDFSEQKISTRQSQLSGQISEYEAASKIKSFEVKNAELSVEIIKNKQQKIEKLEKAGLINRKEIIDQKLTIEQELQSAELDLLNKKIQANKEAANITIEQSEKIAKQREENLQRQQLTQQLALKQQELLRNDSPETIENNRRELETKEAEQSVELAHQRLNEIKQLEMSGLINTEEIMAKKEEAEKELLQTQINLVDKQIAAKQAALQKQIDAEKKKNEQIFKDFEDRLAKEQSLQEISNTTAISNIRSQQLAGVQSKEQAEKAIARIEQQARKQELASLQSQLQDIKSLEVQGVITAEEAAKRKIDINKQLAEGNLSLIEQQIQAEEQKNAQILRSLEDRLAKEQSLQEISNITAISNIRSQQLAGVQSKEQAEKAIAKIEIQARKQELAGLQSQLQDIKSLEAKGVITVEEAAKRKININKQLAEGNLSLIEQQIQAEEQKNQEIIKAFEDRLAAEQSTREISNTTAITSVRSQQLAGVQSKEEAEAAIAQIEQQARQAEMAGLQQQLNEVRKLEAQGVLSVEDAAKRKADLNKQLVDGNLALIEQQIQAEEQAAQRAIEAKLKVVEANLRAAKIPLEMQSGRAEIASNRLGLSSDLSNAQTDVMQAVNTLESQRIDFQMRQLELQAQNAKSEKEKEKALLQAEKLKSQAFKNQYIAMQQTQQAQQAQLEISHRQRDIELQREKVSARIALLESQAELQKAKINGASVQEIQALAEMVKLRQETLSFTNEAIASQEKLKQLESERLRIQQRAEKEKAAQERLLELEQKATEATGKEREHIKQQLEEAKKIQDELSIPKIEQQQFLDFEHRQKINELADNKSKKLINMGEQLNNSELNSNMNLGTSFDFGSEIKRSLKPIMFKKSNNPVSKPISSKSHNFSGDIVGAKEITINVSSNDRSSGTDIERTVLNALGSVIDKTRSKLNEA